MNRTSRLLLSAIALSLPATYASAELGVGGWVNLTADSADGDAELYVEADVLASYTTGDFVFGLGTHFEESLTGAQPEPINGSGYFLLSYQNFTLTAGRIPDAGNIFAEDYFTYSDNTETSDHIRLDWAINDNHHIAISSDLGDNSEIDLGYQGRFMNVGSLPEVIVTAAVDFDLDSGGLDFDDAALLVTVPYDDWAFQAIYQNANLSFSGADIDYGVAIWRSFNNLTLGAAVEFDETPGTPVNFGFAAQYTINDRLSLRGEYTVEQDVGENEYEFALLYTFGKPQPAGDVRFHRKEHQRWYADF